MYPTDLTDSQWQNIKKQFGGKIMPRRIDWKRKRKYPIGMIINAILYMTRMGAQ